MGERVWRLELEIRKLTSMLVTKVFNFRVGDIVEVAEHVEPELRGRKGVISALEPNGAAIVFEDKSHLSRLVDYNAIKFIPSQDL